MSEESSSGHIVWKDWILDYDVLGTEGLCLLNGWFNGRFVFEKLSIPVIRVKYIQDQDLLHNPIFKNGCGPYNDQIRWDTADFGEDLLNWARGGPHHLVKVKDCSDRYICIRTGVDKGGVDYLELGVYARIGAYHLYQHWFLFSLGEVGEVQPMIRSKGLSCNLDHWHHPHWRFHFALDRKGFTTVKSYNGSDYKSTFGNEGHYYNESPGYGLDGKPKENLPIWSVVNETTKARVSIFPPIPFTEDHIVGPNRFSDLDVYLRNYRPEEDGAWPFRESEDMRYAVNGPLFNDERIVFWLVCHLFHRYDGDKDHWHAIGGRLRFERGHVPMQPWQRRKVRLHGTMHLKDFKAVGHDKWSHPTFDQSVPVDPAGPHREISVIQGVGDIRSELRLIIDLNDDGSLQILMIARLLDEDDEVASASKTSSLLKDGSIKGSASLKDYHSGDPDTADIDFAVENLQDSV
ncbi:MAG: hypothetical protein AB7F35_10545 [Acetobacteraceae bacterium]